MTPISDGEPHGGHVGASNFVGIVHRGWELGEQWEMKVSKGLPYLSVSSVFTGMLQSVF